MKTNRASYQLPFIWRLWAAGGSLLLGMLIAYTHPAMALLPPLLLLGAMGLWLLWRHPDWGIYLLLLLAMAINTLIRIFPFLPFGVLIDGCVLLLTMRMLYESYRQGRWWAPLYTPWSLPIGVWMGWHLLCLFNPEAPSRLVWLYAMRPAAIQVFLFFIAYHYMRTMVQVRQLLVLMIALTSFCATWGVVQFINGYFPFEMDYIVANQAVHLVYIQGRWRSFGTLGSPAHFGVLMAAMTIGVLPSIGGTMQIGLFQLFTIGQRIRTAQYGIKRAEKSMQVVEQDLAIRISSKYLDYLQTLEQAKITLDILASQEELLRMARKRFERSEGKIEDCLMAQSSVQQAKGSRGCCPCPSSPWARP